MVSGNGTPSRRVSPGDLMARLGGGDAGLLAEFPHERAKFMQMAGVLLTTSGIAVISMTFALHDALREALFWSLVFGLVWGIIILNLDRFLVLSMGSIRNKGRLLLIFAPRFAMAVVLAAVISTPLVLRVFASDIKTQLFAIQQQESARQAKLIANSSEAREARTIAGEIAADKSIMNGNLPGKVTNPAMQQAQALVNQLTPQVQQDQSAEISAREAWQCELYGVGPHCDNNSGIPGPGPISAAKEQAYKAALGTFNKDNGRLKAAEFALAKAQKAARGTAGANLAHYQKQAKAHLPGLERQYAKLETYLKNTTATGTATANSDVGILAQLQALSAASAHNSSLNAARIAVLLLFFLIEILPVTVKFLLNLGPLSAYEDALISRDAEKTDDMNLGRAERRRLNEGRSEARISKVESQRQIDKSKLEAHVAVEKDMRDREVDLGKHANEYVAGEMKMILDAALGVWGHDVRAMLAGGSPGGGAGGGPGGGSAGGGIPQALAAPGPAPGGPAPGGPAPGGPAPAAPATVLTGLVQPVPVPGVAGATSNGSSHAGPAGGPGGLPSGSKL